MPAPAPRRIVLVGFMAAGKTAVGKALARRLRWRHVDLDAVIEQTAGTTVRTIFETRGEAAFREMEMALTPGVLASDGVVLSTGGGWVTNPAAVESLPPRTATVWLRVDPATVAARLDRNPRAQPARPLLEGQERDTLIRELLRRREPLYARAQFTVDTDHRSVEELVDELERTLFPADDAHLTAAGPRS